MTHACACLVAALLVVACDRPSPISPSPASATAATPPPTPRFALSGVVRAAGFPVAGAKVARLTFETGTLIDSTMTDGNGSYRLLDVANVSPYSGALISVSTPEYFTETKYIPMNQDLTFDFELERATKIFVGETIQSPVGVGTRCASLGYGGGAGALCQRFSLVMPASGTLEVTVSSTPASHFDATVLKPDGSIGAYGSSFSPLRLVLPVDGRLAYQIDVVHISPPIREFVLNTMVH